MIGFLLLVAWVLFLTITIHQVWPAIHSWLQGGEHEYANVSQLGQHRHRDADGMVSVYDLLERCAA